MAPYLSNAVGNGSSDLPHEELSNIETRLFINGEFTNAKSGKTFQLYNPATEKFVVSVQEANESDVDLAVNAAEDAFIPWSERSALDRASYFYKLADLFEKNAGEFSKLDAVCMGKPVSINSRSLILSSMPVTESPDSFQAKQSSLLPCFGTMQAKLPMYRVIFH